MKEYRRYYTTKQRRNFDCGITCVLNILRCYGMAVSRNDFKGLLCDRRIRKDGASMWDLISSINNYGLEAQGVVCDAEALMQDGCCPAILVVEVGVGTFHYIVAHEVSPTSIVVADPSIMAARVVKMPWHKFVKRYHWRGAAILIS